MIRFFGFLSLRFSHPVCAKILCPVFGAVILLGTGAGYNGIGYNGIETVFADEGNLEPLGRASVKIEPLAPPDNLRKTETPVLQPDFVTGFEDLPLAPGIENLPDSQIIFDSDEGRLIEARAIGVVGVQPVENFYIRSLPQLGWHHLGKNRFLREGEVLTIDFEAYGESLMVRFALSPERIEIP